MIRRHTTSSIAIHWFNAACFLTLLLSGFALMSNAAVQPIGMWWPKLWEGAITAASTLTLHVVAGLLWVVAYALYLTIYRREAFSFLREILAVSLIRDISWCTGKGLQLVVGEEGFRKLGPKLGLGAELSPQGFYNAGQKLMAVAAVGCGLGLAASGITLLFLAREPGGREYAPMAAPRTFLLCRRDGDPRSGAHLYGRPGSGGGAGASFHAHRICSGGVRPAPQPALVRGAPGEKNRP